jgi:hypothetical protein
MKLSTRMFLVAALTCALSAAAFAQSGPAEFPQPVNAWLKRSPLPGGPVSPAMGYETTLGYDPAARLVVRWGGHNQGGGGEQNAETWIFDPITAKWTLREPNKSPPGVCCGQQNVFDPVGGRFIRFSSFSGSHGWQWFREIYLNNTSVWNYSVGENVWRDMRPAPTVRTAPLRCASWDSDAQVVVVFGGEGSNEGTVVYDPYTNTWTRMRPAKEPQGRSGGNMAYDQARRVHVMFGAQFIDDPHTWVYDLKKNEWRDMKPAVQPPTDRNDPVLTYDPHNKVVIAVVRVMDKVDAKDKSEVARGHCETWAYDAGKNEWKKMNPAREPDTWGNRRRCGVFLPDLNVMLMEAYVNPGEKVPGVDREQQIWTYRVAEAPPRSGPAAPTGVRATATPAGAVVSWALPTGPDTTEHVVLRGEGDKPWLVDYREVGRVRGDLTVFNDGGLKPGGTIYHYAVQAVGPDGKTSDMSVRARLQPRIVEDVTVSVVSSTEVRLGWKSLPGKDVAGYHVERAVVEVFTEDQIIRLKKDTAPLEQPSVGAIKSIGAFVRITRQPVKDTTFTDATIDLSKPVGVEGEATVGNRFDVKQIDAAGKPYRYAVYAYRVRAVNSLGVQGGPSPYFLTIPGPVQYVFSKEEGEKCHIKWAANPETGLKGYRVYRMNGPRINGPGQTVSRLIAEPITETTFTDPAAGKGVQRYYVVAVDALGQEGIPSSPTWFNREYKRYYVPFVGEWHQ